MNAPSPETSAKLETLRASLRALGSGSVSPDLQGCRTGGPGKTLPT